MHVYIVFCHPSKKSFTFSVLESFLAGLTAAGHSYTVGDLYAMDFKPDMDLGHYDRETSFDPSLPVPPDEAMEQKKIDEAAALVFVYPVWWSDCPAKLEGWFDRVWTLEYAYSYENGSHAAPGFGVTKALMADTSPGELVKPLAGRAILASPPGGPLPGARCARC